MTASLLPPNATALERALADTIGRLGDVPVPIREITNPDTCPVEFLPFLAWGFRVDVWRPEWPEETKREVVKAAIPTHRIKGTVASVKAALAALNADVEIKEWFETGGAPRTFEAVVSVDSALNEEVVLSAARIAAIADTIDANKPLGAHYTLSILAKVLSSLQAAVTMRARAEVTIEAEPKTTEPMVAIIEAPMALLQTRSTVTLEVEL